MCSCNPNGAGYILFIVYCSFLYAMDYIDSVYFNIKEDAMIGITAPWIQSLLLLHPRRLPNIDLLNEDLQQLFNTQVEYSQGENTVRLPDDRYVERQWAKAVVRGGKKESELCHDAPFWTAQLHPLTTFLHVAGNEVVVNDLPSTIHFGIHCVVCAANDVAFAWEVQGPYIANRSSNTIFSAHEKRVKAQRLGPPWTPNLANINVVTVRDFAAPTFVEEGLYFIRVKLDDQEAHRAPLLVRRPNG